MKRTHHFVLALGAVAALSACSSTPEHIDELEAARAAVPQVEASPRAGVAATNVADARKALDEANRLADKGADLEDIKYHSMVASMNAQIANEKILTAQAKEEIDKGTAERQQVLIEAREREAQRAAQKAQNLEQELANLKAKKTDRGLVVTLGDVLFDTGKSTLKPGAYRTMDRLAEVLKEDPNRKVLIEGHTDSVGSEEFNLQLSQQRADAVEAALFERGVPAAQVRTMAKGESAPVASNANAYGRQQNRRVEMVFQTASRVASDVD